MTRHRISGLVAVAAVSLGISVCLAPPALADPSWNGQYEVTFFTAQKSGTSMAANQPESMHVDVYTFSSSCSSGKCVATITDGPAPRNPTVPQPVQFTWDGSAWVSNTTWRWACLLDDGTIEWSPAGSTARYTPKPDGSLMGEWHTDIASGACQGTLDMPMEAVPI
jgi:hypothetical protein